LSPRRRLIRLLSLVYLAAALADFGYHIVNASYVGDQRLGWSDIVVGFEASLFWPVDVGVQILAR
jgi:hypothetical protein